MSAALLLVEDDASLAGITRRFLLQAGYKVTLAVSGEEALSLIQKQKPDLVVSDVQLPGISGLKLCELLKENKTTASLPYPRDRFGKNPGEKIPRPPSRRRRLPDGTNRSTRRNFWPGWKPSSADPVTVGRNRNRDPGGRHSCGRIPSRGHVEGTPHRF